MKSEQDYLRIGDLIRFQVNHFDHGAFLHSDHGHDVFPYARIYGIHPHSPCKSSTIGERSNWKNRLILKAGSLYYIPPSYDLRYRFEKGLMMFAIHFSLELIDGLDAYAPHDTIQEDSQCSQEILDVWKELTGPSSLSRVIRLKGRLFKIGTHFAHQSLITLPILTARAHQFGALLTWIRKNIRANLRINELADFCDKNPDSLSREFSQAMGMSLKSHLNRELITEAIRRLTFTQESVRQVASELNFNDEYYFNRFFKKHTGSSPGEFRKRYSPTCLKKS
ncbi:MAG: AraC family transcriptional regulator [Spirochaetales bacterium]|nr:AraC family transcriptional regulator [Spirochaetales bacterium]